MCCPLRMPIPGKQFKSITNAYDIEIMYERFNNLLSEVIEIIEENHINRLNILALGDFIEGMTLRLQQLSQLKIGMTQQTIQFMRFMVSWLNKLSEYVYITYYQALRLQTILKLDLSEQRQMSFPMKTWKRLFLHIYMIF